MSETVHSVITFIHNHFYTLASVGSSIDFVRYLLLPACGKDMDIVCTVLPDLCCNAIICLPIPLFFVLQAYFVALCILHSKRKKGEPAEFHECSGEAIPRIPCLTVKSSRTLPMHAFLMVPRLACSFFLEGNRKKFLSMGFLVEMINLHENTLYGYTRPHNVDEDPKKQALPDRLSKAADTDYVVGIIHTPGPGRICIL